MRRHGATRDTGRVPLFPFLAVLLCTMGVLLVLLVVIAHQARVHAAQATTAEEGGASEGDLLAWRNQELEEARRRTAAELDRDRTRGRVRPW